MVTRFDSKVTERSTEAHIQDIQPCINCWYFFTLDWTSLKIPKGLSEAVNRRQAIQWLKENRTRTNNGLQNITLKTKDWTIITPHKLRWAKLYQNGKESLSYYWHLPSYSSYKCSDKSWMRKGLIKSFFVFI